ncbi:MAG: class E sortase [Clostridiales bacterium]|jgi:LPXTG-site transpeptidase (sortase) family protein|nr:class E sortase [Clostridiales bacterium]
MEKKNKKGALRWIRLALLALVLLCAIGYAYEARRPYRNPNALDVAIDNAIGRDWDVDYSSDLEYLDSVVFVEMPADSVPVGELVVTPERSAYDGSMTLVVPKLSLEMPVQDGATLANLKKGPSLFEFAGLPGNSDTNVAIAGHRSGGMFLDLDKLGEGDFIYLVCKDRVFKYLFKETEVVLPQEWRVVASQGFSCVSLITCTPVNVADHRLVVRGELVDSFLVDSSFSDSSFSDSFLN